MGCQNDPCQSRKTAARQIGEKLDGVGAQAHQTRGFLIAADGKNGAACAGIVQDYRSDDVSAGGNQGGNGKDPEIALPQTGKTAFIGNRHRLVVCKQKRRAAGSQHGRQRGNERHDVEPGNQEPIESPDDCAHSNASRGTRQDAIWAGEGSGDAA